MEDNWIKVKYFDHIFVDDWPLVCLEGWIKPLLKNGFIDRTICEIFNSELLSNQNISELEFKCMITERKHCVNSLMCQSKCLPESPCFTAGHIKRLLVNNNLNKYSGLIDELEVQRAIVEHFFVKLTFSCVFPKFRTRVGVLLFNIEEPISDEFVKEQQDMIMKQLSIKYYVSMAHLLRNNLKFKFVKKYIDTVVIVVNSVESLNCSFTTLQPFSYLTIFLIKTAGSMNLNDDTILERYRRLFPRNKIIIHDVLSKRESLVDVMQGHIVPLRRFAIAFHSFFAME